jgi:hypothetical protein
MIVVNLKGGLGNQMFQYAVAYSLSKIKNTELYLDLRYYNDKYNSLFNKNFVKRKCQLNIFKCKYKIANKKILKKFKLTNSIYLIRYIKMRFFSLFAPGNFIYETNFIYEKKIFSSKKENIYLDGYWQNEKYFLNFKNDLKKIFTIKLKKKNKKILNFISKLNDNNAVCINVRRADYLNNNNNISKDYYLKSINLILKKFKKVKFYIFSDDIIWCKKNFKNMNINYQIVDHSYAGKFFTNYFFLMTNFKIFVISNSTFSWWAAWLSKYKKTFVIAPKKWFPNSKVHTEIIPDRWIKI